MGRKNRKNRQVHGTVVDIGAKGMAVCKTEEGEVFLVDGAVPGDVISAILVRKKKGVWHGKLQEIVTYSPDRVRPPCPHFGDCGGCKWQDLMYERQIQLKEKSVRDVMQRIAHVEVDHFYPIVGCEQIYGYRNKLEFTFANRRWFTESEILEGKVIGYEKGLGFHRPGRFDKVLDIHTCLLQPTPSNEIRNYVREKAIELDLSFYDARSQDGFLRNLMIRTTQTGDLMVLLVVKKPWREKIEALLSAVRYRFPEITSLQYVVNHKPNDSIHDLDVHLYFGKPYITENLGKKEFHIGPKSFFQTNSSQAKVLYDKVIQFAAFRGDETVYDLYSGLGSIGIYLADKVGRVVGIEEVDEAVQWALENTRLNQARNCRYYCGDVKEVLTSGFISDHGHPDVLIVDPPRAGLHQDVVNFIMNLEPKKIVYVSCNPATQARDLAVWKEKYRCRAMQPVDMFPHTSHVENIALLELMN